MKTLQDLVNRCRGKISICIHSHRGNKQSMKEYTDHLGDSERIEDDVINRIIDAGQIVEIWVYSDAPFDFLKVNDSTIDGAVAKAHQILDHE
jgi:hypothetical protein